MKKRKAGCCLLLPIMLFVMLLFPASKADAAQKSLTLNNKWVNGNIKVENDADYYRFNVPSTGFVHIDYQGWSIEDSYIAIWDADLTEEYAKYNVYTSSDANPLTKSMDFILEAGTYYAKVYPCGNHTGSYRLRGSFTTANSNEKEPNDGFNQAMKLSANTKITGVLSQTDGVDFYKFTVPRKQAITITYTPRIGDSYFSIWDSDFQMLERREVYTASETNPLTYVYESTLDSGTYYIKIEPYGTNTGRYQLLLKGENLASTSKKVSSIKISGNKKVAAGQSFTLKAAVSPSSATNKAVSWSSSNPSVASVSSTGKVTAKAPGKTTITVKAKDGSGKKKSCTVIVLPKKMSSPVLKSTGSKGIRITWNAQTNVSGYQVQYSTNSKFASYATDTRSISKSAKRLDITGLSKKTYYVRIRSYVTIGSDVYYSSWSTVKQIKVK